MEMPEVVARHALGNIKSVYMNKWKQAISQDELERLMIHISDTLGKTGYLKEPEAPMRLERMGTAAS